MGQTVNLLVFTFGGSNPSLPTKAEVGQKRLLPSGVRIMAIMPAFQAGNGSSILLPRSNIADVAQG